MHSSLSSVEIQRSAAYALSSIVQGNVAAAAIINTEANAAILEHAMALHGKDPHVRQHLAKVLVSVQGLSGVVQALSSDDPLIHYDVLWEFADSYCNGSCDETADTIVHSGAIERVAESMQRFGCY